MNNSTTAPKAAPRLNITWVSLWAVYVLSVASFGVVTNVTTIVVVVLNKKLKSTIYCWMACLSSNDCLFCLCGPPLQVLAVVAEQQFLAFPKDVCSFLILLHVAFLWGSSFGQMLIAMSRFIAVMFPHFYQRNCTKRRHVVLLWMVFTYVMPVILSVLAATKVAGAFRRLPMWGACVWDVRLVAWKRTMESLFVYVPSAVIAFCYGCICIRLLISGRKSQAKGSEARRHARGSFIMFLNFIIFVALLFPATITATLSNTFYGSHPYALLWFFGCYWTSNAVNPIVYYIFSEDLRNSYKQYFCPCYKNNAIYPTNKGQEMKSMTVSSTGTEN